MRLLFLTLLLLSQVCSAQNTPSSGEIASKLAPMSRSMSTEVTPRGIAIPEAKPDEPPSINLNINFEFDSAALTSEGKVLVGNLGRALKDPRLAGQKFIIEGHTDGKGNDAYNKALSERRAETVRKELIAQHGADASRLEAIGYGKTQLLDKANAESWVNRRVKVVNKGG
jgi:outer membrane protein OmpA-like peptidoglycan-associated protein